MSVFNTEEIFGGNLAVYENEFPAYTMATQLDLVLLAHAEIRCVVRHEEDICVLSVKISPNLDGK